MTMTINLILFISAFLCFLFSLQVSKIIKLRNKMLQDQKKELEEYTKQLEAYKIVFNDLNKQLIGYKIEFIKNLKFFKKKLKDYPNYIQAEKFIYHDMLRLLERIKRETKIKDRKLKILGPHKIEIGIRKTIQTDIRE